MIGVTTLLQPSRRQERQEKLASAGGRDDSNVKDSSVSEAGVTTATLKTPNNVHYQPRRGRRDDSNVKDSNVSEAGVTTTTLKTPINVHYQLRRGERDDINVKDSYQCKLPASARQA